MAVLAKTNFQSQQRLDLVHLLGEQSFAAYDFRAMLQMMNGLDKNFIVNGLEVSAVSGLSVSISVKNAMILSPLDGTVSFYTGTSDDPDATITVPPSNSAVFIEAYLERNSGVPVTTAFFDPSAVSETNPAGNEFTASVDFEQFIELKFRFSVNGFSSDAIPIAKVSTGVSSVESITDCRELFFRLGSGGANPNPFNRFAWSSNREETSNPGPASSIGKLNSNNPYFSKDADGAKNDKAITNMKQWMDAVMTVLAELKDTPTWYFPTEGLSIPNLLFLTGNATTIVPVPNRVIQWSRENDNRLRSKGSGLPTTWAQNFGPVSWYLGGSFVSSSSRKFSNKDWSVQISPGESLFLLLQRETRPSLVPASPVKWGTESISPAALSEVSDITRHVKGNEGDFTGIAIGDYVRKEGDVYYEYYRVVGIVETGFPIIWPEEDINNENIDGLNWGTVASDACTGLLLERSVDGTSVEPYRWFRTAYYQEELFKTAENPHEVSSNSPSPLTIPIDDINLYWLGRHSSQTGTNIFLFRDYGNMNPGEEFGVLDDSFSKPLTTELFLRVDTGIQFDSSGVLSSLNPNVFSVQKRKTENILNFGIDNFAAWQTFSLSSSVTFNSDGDGLWVRLDDNNTAPAVLSSGVVDPAEPAVPALNVYEIIPSSRNPLRNYKNNNVFLICRRVTINGVPSLQFFDGKVIATDGVSLEKDITKIVTGVNTSTVNTTVVNHSYLRNTSNFIWSARRTSTGRSVLIGATHSSTGLTLDATPAGSENLTITFTRHIP